MENSEKKNVVSFYKIDKSLFKDTLSTNEIIKEIVDKAEGYKPETHLKVQQQNGFNISLFYLHKEITYEKWELFFAPILEGQNDTFNQDDGERYYGKYLSFVCFFDNLKEIYAVCMGKAYMVIDHFIEADFGFDLLTRLIRPESNFLRQLSANNLSGSTFEDINFFRSSESFNSQNDFGKIFKQAISELDQSALTQLGFDLNEVNKSNCLAKSSFTLKTGITLSQITKNILPALIKITNGSSAQNFQINKVKAINKHNPIYSDLYKTLVEKIRTDFLSFDFFSPEDPQDFFLAEQYSISKYAGPVFFSKHSDNLTNLENVKKKLEEEDILNFNDQQSFLTEIDYIKINAHDNEDNSVLRRGFSLVRGLHGEVIHKGNNYFWLNGKFWHIDKDFLDYFSDLVFQTMNQEAYSITSDNIPFLPFDLKNQQDEDDYNSKMGNIAGFLNLDKKTPNGVELCDLLYETSDTIYLIHIKKGFDRNVRDLASQILTSARFLNEDKDKNLFTAKVYSHGKGDPVSISKAEFLKKFKKQTVFVFGFVHDKNVLDRKQFKKLNSNIAKLEIFELLKDFKKFTPPYNIKIVQLPSK